VSFYSVITSTLDLLEPSDSIAVAVSGGADSMVLAHVLKQWSVANNIRLVALTVDHGLRSESASEAQQVHAWLQDSGIEHHILHWRGEKPSSNIQHHARNARYELLTTTCKTLGIDVLAVAHHGDDQAETVLMRLARGSGVDGLAAMEPIKYRDGLITIRPMLEVTKQDIIAYAQQQKIEWIEDPSNDSLEYDRVKFRQFLNGFADKHVITKRLCQTAKHMRRAQQVLDKQLHSLMSQVAVFELPSHICVDMSAWQKLDEEIQLRMLTSWMRMLNVDFYKPRFENLEHLAERLLDWNHFTGATLSGCVFKSNRGKLLIFREMSAIENSSVVLTNKEVVWDGRVSCYYAQAGDVPARVEPLMDSGFASIKKNLGPLSLPKLIIHTLPALKILEKTVAVPHINYYDASIIPSDVSMNNITYC